MTADDFRLSVTANNDLQITFYDKSTGSSVCLRLNDAVVEPLAVTLARLCEPIADDNEGGE
jgi:hypothetical protein